MTFPRPLLLMRGKRRPPWLSIGGHQEDMVATAHRPGWRWHSVKRKASCSIHVLGCWGSPRAGCGSTGGGGVAVGQDDGACAGEKGVGEYNLRRGSELAARVAWRPAHRTPRAGALGARHVISSTLRIALAHGGLYGSDAVALFVARRCRSTGRRSSRGRCARRSCSRRCSTPSP